MLHSSPSKQVPVFLFHDGSGQIDMYARMGGHDRTTYAFLDPHFGDDRRVEHSIHGMAKQYVDCLLLNTDQSSLILGGRCSD
jgi:thioesterase domain-containing protein